MLRTIPKRIMTHSATLKSVSSTDRWGNPVYTEYALSHIHIQPTHEVTKNSSDKSVNLKSVLFFDPRVSSPVVDWNTLQKSSDIANGQMKVETMGNEYTVWSIDFLPDDEGRLHHVEVLLY